MKTELPRIAIQDVELYTPVRVVPHGVLLIEDGKISALGPAGQIAIPRDAQVMSWPGSKVFPGFIDVHVHGLLGFDAFGPDLSNVIRALPRYGVTSFLATTITLPLDDIYQRLSEMAAVIENPPPGANCLGIHLEGPHLSTKRPGMANAAWFRPLDIAEFDQMQERAEGHIRMITFAPEDGEALAAIQKLRERNVIPVIGHSDASYELAAEAVSLGMLHATHTFNAMSSFHHRAPGVIGAVLAFPEVTGQLIADGHHVHAGAIRTLVNAKGISGVCLISDAEPFAGLPDGSYAWQDYPLIVTNGVCRLPDGTLAGAHALMDTGFRNLIQLAAISPAQAAVCASVVPARELNLAARKGRLQVDFDADLVVLDETLQPQLTVAAGKIVWRRE